VSRRNEQLALLGGAPVRTAAFSSRPFYDEQEIEAVTAALRDGLLSGFVGSPLAGTRDQLRQTSEELGALDERVSFVGGPNVRRFEAAWAAAHRARFAVAMNSATSAETAALMALDVGPGAEVITTPLSFTATATAIVAANAVPVFADIDADTMCLDPEAVEQAITPRTRCILPVHWCGNAGYLRDVLDVAARHGIPVLEDAAQAPGTEYEGRLLGTWGAASTFSFSAPKNVTTGEGGMVVTDDAALAEKCRLIRNHGESVPVESDDDDFVVNVVGQNFRMTEPTAALGWVQTAKLSTVNEIRHRNHAYLVARLTEVVGDCLVPQRLTHPDTFAAYTSAFRWLEGDSGLGRDAVAAALRAEGIPVATSVVRLMSDNELFRRRLAYGREHHPFAGSAVGTRVQYRPEALPRAHRVHDREYLAFFLAGWPNTVEDMDDIVAAFEKIVARRSELAEHARTHGAGLLAYDRGRG
jgi:dTDP-4-amino-4,6-dideoxygalactose transaminase